MSVLERLFPARSLDGVLTPTFVRVEGRIESPNDVVSPVTGWPAALVRWMVLVEHSSQGSHRGQRDSVYEPIASGFYGDLVLVSVEGRLVEVAVDGALELDCVVDRAAASPLGGPLPARIADLVESVKRQDGMLYYQEHHLAHADPVRLSAYVQPRPAVGGAYRGDARPSYVTRSDLGTVTLRDRVTD